MTDSGKKFDYDVPLSWYHRAVRPGENLLRQDSFDQAFAKGARARRMATPAARHRSPSRSRMPSASSYILMSGAAAAALFFMLWWMLHSGGDDTPWVPAGLAASVVMLVAMGAREVVMRRAWTRHILERERNEQKRERPSQRSSNSQSSLHSSSARARAVDSYSARLRSVQRQCEEADAPGALPEAHLETYLSCKDFLEMTEQTLRTAILGTDTRLNMRAGQERVRVLARQHLLEWARGASRTLTHQAQLRVRLSDKIETAQRALEVIDSALKLYPEESELRESEAAVREFITTVKVSHWIELAERAAFKGHYARAVDRYRDALFYLSRGEVTEATRAETAERIQREIEGLRARLKMRKISATPTNREVKQ